MTLSDKLPAIFLTFDRDIELLSFCVKAYAQHWPACPFRFIVPVNSEASRRTLIDNAPPGIEVQPIVSDPRIVPTLRALADATSTCPWIFWGTSDRYPYAAVRDGSLNRVASAVAAGKLPSDLGAVRITRWRDIHDAGEETALIGDTKFQIGCAGRFGHWHHQFMRHDVFELFIAGADDDDDLRTLARRVSNDPARQAVKVALPERSLMKFEETMIDGKLTLNFALRQLRLNRSPDGSRLGAATEGYTSPVIPHRNTYWAKQGSAANDILRAPMPVSPFHVVSFGGVGSKMIARWLQPNAGESAWRVSHSHRRLPPLSLEQGQVIYVFGDPRNAVLSLFNRREGRTAQHHFIGKIDQSPIPDFVLRHAKNLEVDVAPMTAEWDLARYLEHGFDLLRLEEHFDYWLYSSLPFPVLFLNYERFERISCSVAKQLNIEPGLVKLAERQSNWKNLPEKQSNEIEALYGHFAGRLASLPDAFILEGTERRTLTAADQNSFDHI